MNRHPVSFAITLALSATTLVIHALAQAPAPSPPAAGQEQVTTPGGRGRGRGPQTPPPPTLTCTSKATETDNKVPAALAKDGFTAIFNGKDLTGWQALIDIGTLKFGAGLNPADLAKLSKAEKAAKQKESNDTYLKHWSVIDGILVFDGVQADKLTPHVEKGGQNLQTVKEYGDVELYVDWCIEAGADSGVYLKNAPQIQMWSNPLGSGGLFNNKTGAEESAGGRRQSAGPLEHVPHHPAQRRHDHRLAEWAAGRRQREDGELLGLREAAAGEGEHRAPVSRAQALLEEHLRQGPEVTTRQNAGE